jgi:hypothetical protein
MLEQHLHLSLDIQIAGVGGVRTRCIRFIAGGGHNACHTGRPSLRIGHRTGGHCHRKIGQRCGPAGKSEAVVVQVAPVAGELLTARR